MVMVVMVVVVVVVVTMMVVMVMRMVMLTHSSAVGKLKGNKGEEQLRSACYSTPGVSSMLFHPGGVCNSIPPRGYLPCYSTQGV